VCPFRPGATREGLSLAQSHGTGFIEIEIGIGIEIGVSYLIDFDFDGDFDFDPGSITMDITAMDLGLSPAIVDALLFVL
jgi:hypothetical protein